MEEVPRLCPSCGTDLGESPYEQDIPSAGAKALRRAALGLLPVMAMLYLAVFFFGRPAPSFSGVSGYYAAAWIGGPSLLLYAITRLFPRDRRVICLRCSWYRDYPAATR